MGACDFREIARKGAFPTAEAAFQAFGDDDRYENGHSYSGGIGMKPSFVTVGTVATNAEADALADKLMQEDHDKWGAGLADQDHRRHLRVHVLRAGLVVTQPVLIEQTSRANYWKMPDGTFYANPASNTNPPPITAGGYKYLSAIKQLKGDRP